MWYKLSQNNEPEKLDINNPQDLSDNHKSVKIEILSKINDISPTSPPQIITEKSSGKRMVLLHGSFQNNQMYYTLDNNEVKDVDGFKEWLKTKNLPENTPYIACDGGKVIFDSHRGLLNPLIKNQFPIDVGSITDQEGKNYLIINRSN